MLPCSLNIFGCSLGPKITPSLFQHVTWASTKLHMKTYRILWLSLVRPHKWVRHGHFYLMCRRKQNKHTKITMRIKHLPQLTNYVFIFGIPVMTFSHTSTARAQYKWRTVEKDQEILTRVQQPHVSIWIYLKGRFCYQRGIESTRQHMWKECLSQKNTLYAHKANDNSNEWVSLLCPTNS